MARLNTRPLIAGAVIGAVAAVGILLLPETALESIISRTHLGDIWSVAQPPFGTKARVLLALFPLAVLTAVGLAIGVFLGRKRSSEEDYGAYPIYDLGAPPSSDPFSPAPTVYPTPAEPEIDETVPVEKAPEVQAAPIAVTASAPTVSAPPFDAATAADLAEIADAVVRLAARVDALESRLATIPIATGAAVPPGLAERLQKIARALDDAG